MRIGSSGSESCLKMGDGIVGVETSGSAISFS
jgi:hypothetical protein